MAFCLGREMKCAVLALEHDRSCYSASDNALRVYFGLELDFCVLCMSLIVQFKIFLFNSRHT